MNTLEFIVIQVQFPQSGEVGKRRHIRDEVLSERKHLHLGQLSEDLGDHFQSSVSQVHILKRRKEGGGEREEEGGKDRGKERREGKRMGE